MLLQRWKMFAAIAVVCCWAPSSAGAAELKPGDTAPDFELPGSDGKMHSLADLTKNQVVVLAWYPKAFTGG